MKLALVTCDSYAVEAADPDDWYVQNILHEDALLTAAFKRYDAQCKRVSWSDPTVDWSSFDAAIIRSTWDYFHRFKEFDRWLAEVSQRTQLCNPLSIVKWNIDKHYLGDLASRGIPIVPSIYIETGSAVSIVDLMRQHGYTEAVVKPCISGAARHTYRITPSSAAVVDESIGPLRAQEAFLLQPFLPAIVEHGEDTLVMAGDRVTHTVRKRAKAGDFRVQDDHGGTVSPAEPTAAQEQLAIQAMRACSPLPAYGRVDMVRDDAGNWLIMELELIEPELWMRFRPQSAEHVARAITLSLRR